MRFCNFLIHSASCLYCISQLPQNWPTVLSLEKSSECESGYWERMQEWAREKTQAVTQMQKPSTSYPGLLKIFVCVLAYLLMLWGFVLVLMCVYMHMYVFPCRRPWIKLTAWCLEWISGLSVKQLFIHPGWDKQTDIQLYIHTQTFHKPYCAIIKVTGT